MPIAKLNEHTNDPMSLRPGMVVKPIHSWKVQGAFTIWNRCKASWQGPNPHDGSPTYFIEDDDIRKDGVLVIWVPDWAANGLSPLGYLEAR